MKKIVLSLLVIMGMSSAGVADELAEEERAPEDKGFYAGLAYSHLSHDNDFAGISTNFELDFYAVMLNVGYKFNPYIAVEGKYNISLGDTDNDNTLQSGDLSVFSIFVKPMYPLAPEMDIYVLLGYSLTNADYSNINASLDEGAFSWGAGAAYNVIEDVSIFAEYTQFYNGTLNGLDHVIDSFNIGVNYKF